MLFEKASRAKLRFPSPKGLLTVEDLWDLPLTSNTGKPNLDDIARTVDRTLRELGSTTSFVEAKESSQDMELKLSMDVVKRVIEVKLAERAAAADAAKRRETKEKIMAIIEAKQNEALAGKSLEELQAQLASL